MRTKFSYLSYFCFLLLLCMNNLCAQCGAEWNPTGNPIGGGPGYSDSVSSWDYYVTTKSELLSALSAATPGDIIYVDDNAEIDVTGQPFLLIPAGVRLCSGRGRALGDTISWGGLIYCTEHERSAELIRTCGKNLRISGLRLRGGFSELEGQQVLTDSFIQPLPVSYYGIYVSKDSCEIDNCEIWGFSGAPVAGFGKDVYLHHNYFHHGNHCYHAYGINFGGEQPCSYRNEANFSDYCQWLVMSGGGNCTSSRGYHSWCIFGHHCWWSFECHRALSSDSCMWDSISNCSFYATGYGHGCHTGYCLPYPARDTTVVQNCWFKNDSAKSIGIIPPADCKLINNHYDTIPPSGVAERLPVAAIWCDTNSGTAPLTVTFHAKNSFDRDGRLIAFYWQFGDSMKPDNYARYTDVNRTVTHTFKCIGKYLVELMVVDDHGIMSYAYKTINITPNDNRCWLSCWIKDRNYSSVIGCYKKQILLDGWVCWEKDLAGNGSWEHVILDVTDSLSGKDSVTLAFRLFCARDMPQYWEPMMYVDDVIIYGANVINSDFESGAWTGNVYTRNDGHWFGSRHGTQYIYTIDFEMDVHSGKRAFFLGTEWNPHYAGDWGKVEQKVSVGALGLSTQNSGKPTCRFSCPYPNPSTQNLAISYQLPNRSMISLKMYDINGRLVRTLVDEEKEPGDYRVIWDRRDEKNRAVVNGIYFSRFSVDDYNATRKLVLLR